MVLTVGQRLVLAGAYRGYGKALHDVAPTTVTGEPLGSANPLAQVVELSLAVYAVDDVGTLAGALGAYFLSNDPGNRYDWHPRPPDTIGFGRPLARTRHRRPIGTAGQARSRRPGNSVVTNLVGRTLQPRTLVAGVVVLALLWWCWSGFAALGNVVRADQKALPLIGFVIMAAAFVLALAIPQAFVDQPGELRGPVVLVAAYLTVRALTIAALWSVTAPDTLARRLIRTRAIAALAAAAAALIVGSALTPLRLADTPTAAWTRIGLWTAAMVIETAGARTPPYPGWAGPSAGHWAERHALIVLVALGESVISLGLGAGTLAELTLTVPIIVAAVLGIALVAALWWLHVDTLALAVEHAVHSLCDDRRIRLTRDVHTYLHLLLIIGIIGAALGLKPLLKTVAAGAGEPLCPVEARLLYLGVVLFLIAETATAVRVFPTTPHTTITAAGGLTAAAFAAHRVPALAALAIPTDAYAGLAVTHRLRNARQRHLVRHSAQQEEHAVETALNQWRLQHR